MGHALPARGNFSAGASRSDLSLDSSTGNYNGDLDNAYAAVTFNPINHLYVGSNANYLDNLTGTIYQSIASAGGAISANLPAQSSHTLDFTSFAAYEVPALHVTFNVTQEHRDQRFDGAPLSSDSYTGTASYANGLFGGMLNATAGVVHTSVSPDDQARTGFLGSLNFSRDIQRWTISLLGNYSQDQQTLLLSYTTNNLGYSANVGRRFGRRSSWTNVVSGSKSGLNETAGSTSFSQNYTTTITVSKLSASAGYSEASGNSILTSNGLVSTPVPLPILAPSAVVLYGGHAYTFGAGSTPIRGLTLSATYSKALSSTQSGTDNSNNKTDQLTARILYLVRKVYFQAGYTRLVQDFSASGTPPGTLGSFYFGISRWFSFF